MNMFTGIAGYVVNTVVGFVCRIVFVRCLAAEYLGVSGLFSNILTMLSLAELGIGSAIAYALYKPIADKNEMKIASLMQFYKSAYRLIGGIVAIIGLAMIPFLKFIINEPPAIKENLYVLYLLYLFNAVFSYYFSYRCTLFTAMQRDYVVKGFNYVITTVQSIIQVIYLLVTREFLGYLIIQIAGNVIYNIWISCKAGKDYVYIKNKKTVPLSETEKKHLLKDVKALAVYKVTGVLVNNTDNLVITYFNGLISVGLASNYVLFSNTLNVLIQQIFNSLTGSVGNLNATESEERRLEFFKAMNMANFWLYGLGAIGIALVSGDLVNLFYGSKFIMNIQIPIILAINFYMIGMQITVYTFKSTLGLFKYGQYILIFTAIINLVLDVILGKKLGVFGIYLATAIARLLTNTWYEPYALYRYGFKKSPFEYLIRYVKYFVVLLIAGGISYQLCEMCKFSILMNVVLKMIICIVVSFCVFTVCFYKTTEFRYLYNKIKQILHFKKYS